MTERIKRLSLLEWGLIVGSVLFLAVAPSELERVIRTNELGFGGPVFFSPWMRAEAVATKAAMQSFELSSLSRPRLWQLAVALVGVLAFYVAGPGLFVLIGTRRPLPDEGVETGFKAGFAMLLTSGLVLGHTAIGPRLAMDQARNSNGNQMARDRMVQKLQVIGQAAYQYYVLPGSLSGGGGSFRGITRSDIKANSPARLEPSGWPLEMEGLMSPVKKEAIQVKSDTLLVVEAAKQKPYPSGKSDTLRATLRVSPSAVLDIEMGT